MRFSRKSIEKPPKISKIFGKEKTNKREFKEIFMKSKKRKNLCFYR